MFLLLGSQKISGGIVFFYIAVIGDLSLENISLNKFRI